MMIYCHELKNNINNEFMCDKCVIDNLNKFIKIAIKINNKLCKRVMK